MQSCWNVWGIPHTQTELSTNHIFWASNHNLQETLHDSSYIYNRISVHKVNPSQGRNGSVCCHLKCIRTRLLIWSWMYFFYHHQSLYFFYCFRSGVTSKSDKRAHLQTLSAYKLQEMGWGATSVVFLCHLLIAVFSTMINIRRLCCNVMCTPVYDEKCELWMYKPTQTFFFLVIVTRIRR